MPIVKYDRSKKEKSILEDKFTLKYIEARKPKQVLIKKPIDDQTKTLLKQIFDGFDYEGNGDISAWDFKMALYYIFDQSEEGKNCTKSERDKKCTEISDMVDIIDADGSGEIDFDEFCEFMTNDNSSNTKKKKGPNSSSNSNSGKEGDTKDNKNERGQDMEKLLDLFISHQRGVQLKVLHDGNNQKNNNDIMTVADSMKCFQFLFKTHLGGTASGGMNKEHMAKQQAEHERLKYYLTKEQRFKDSNAVDIPKLYLGTTTDLDISEYEMIRDYDFFGILFKPFDIAKFMIKIESFKKKYNTNNTEDIETNNSTRNNNTSDNNNHSSNNLPDDWGKKIIIADDNNISLSLIRRELVEHGFDVTVASEGKDVLERMTLERYDITLLDLNMSGFSGIDVMKYFQARKVAKMEQEKEEKRRQGFETARLKSWAQRLAEDKRGIRFETTNVLINDTLKQNIRAENNASRLARSLTGPLTPNRKGYAGRPITAGLLPVSLPGDELMPLKRREVLNQLNQQIFTGYGQTRPLTADMPETTSFNLFNENKSIGRYGNSLSSDDVEKSIRSSRIPGTSLWRTLPLLPPGSPARPRRNKKTKKAGSGIFDSNNDNTCNIKDNSSENKEIDMDLTLPESYHSDYHLKNSNFGTPDVLPNINVDINFNSIDDEGFPLNKSPIKVSSSSSSLSIKSRPDTKCSNNDSSGRGIKMMDFSKSYITDSSNSRKKKPKRSNIPWLRNGI